MSLDSHSRAVEWIPMPGVALVLCHPDEPVENSTASLNDYSQSCLDAMAGLGVRSLRTIEMMPLKMKRAVLGEREFSCAAHVLAELQRVVFAERALRDGDFEQFGQYLFQSHDSARELQLQTNEHLSLLVELARRTRGCLGARALLDRTATLNLVIHHAVPGFVESLKHQFARQTGIRVETCLRLPVNGAGKIQA